MLKQAHAELFFQHSQHGFVQQRKAALSPAQQVKQLGTVPNRAWHLNVHARLQRPAAGFGHRFANALHLVGVADRTVVTDAQPLEPHALPQQAGEHPTGHRHRLAVQHIIAGHDTLQTALGDSGLEGFGVYLLQQSGRGVALGAVDAAQRILERRKVLGHALGRAAVHRGALHAAGVGSAQCGGQRGVFAVALALTSHPRIPADVQHRGQDVGDAAGGFLAGDSAGDLFLQRGVPPGAPGQSVGETGGLLDKCPAQAFHVEDGRDVVGAVGHDALLHAPLPGGGFVQRGDAAHLEGAHLAGAQRHGGGVFVEVCIILA